ncbi:MAG TPA: biopolymer transporter ExbD [Gammaproteobacteria bacterium]|nr:biopolymer transporter ExbD [Gammaproteobacteria bacterium]
MKQSRRAQRMDRRNAWTRRLPPFNLVALMDIFTILVFFLLVHSSDVQDISLPKIVDLPESIAKTSPHNTPTVLVTSSDIQVGGRTVAQIEPLLNHDALVIQALRDALTSSQSGTETVDRGEITILSDRTTSYQILKKVMATCADAGFGRISLAVMQQPTSQGG